MFLISQNVIKHTTKGLPAQSIDEPRPSSNINQAKPSSDKGELGSKLNVDEPKSSSSDDQPSPCSKTCQTMKE